MLSPGAWLHSRWAALTGRQAPQGLQPGRTWQGLYHTSHAQMPRGPGSRIGKQRARQQLQTLACSPAV